MTRYYHNRITTVEDVGLAINVACTQSGISKILTLLAYNVNMRNIRYPNGNQKVTKELNGVSLLAAGQSLHYCRCKMVDRFRGEVWYPKCVIRFIRRGRVRIMLINCRSFVRQRGTRDFAIGKALLWVRI